MLENDVLTFTRRQKVMERTEIRNIVPVMANDSLEDPLDENSSDEDSDQEENQCKKLSCGECGEKFMFHYSLQKHIKKVHLGGKPHECSECGKRFGAINSLKRHMLTHTGEKPHVCPLCQQSFSQDINLTRHLRRHFNDRPYECETCHKRFTDSGILKIHMRIHSGEKPYACNLCGKKFTQNGSLEKHIKIHGKTEKVFKCTYCEKEFSSNSHLHSHLRVHNTEKKFECTMCFKKYSSFSGLYKHMKIHESEGNYGVLQRRKGVCTGDKIYECSVCNKKFQSFSGHYKHMKMHDGKSSPSDSQAKDEEYLRRTGITVAGETDLHDEGDRNSSSIHEEEYKSLIRDNSELKEISKVYIKEEENEPGSERDDILLLDKESLNNTQIKKEHGGKVDVMTEMTSRQSGHQNIKNEINVWRSEMSGEDSGDVTNIRKEEHMPETLTCSIKQNVLADIKQENDHEDYNS